MQLPLQNFRKNVHKSLIHMEAASPKMRNRHFGVELGSAAGFRFCEFLAWGRVLYIDDLTTIPSARGKGYAGALLDWLTEQAAQQGCDAVHLDTGYTRHAAHRLYLSKGFEMTSHHMAKLIAKG